MITVRISCGNLSFNAELFDTNTARMILKECPITGTANVWGDEIYFPLSCSADSEKDAQEEVEVGTLAYWPPGQAFCIFFGPTPVSTSAKPRAYSPVNIIGKIHGNLEDLRSVSDGMAIKVELITDN